jgi:hypothetical protein
METKEALEDAQTPPEPKVRGSNPPIRLHGSGIDVGSNVPAIVADTRYHNGWFFYQSGSGPGITNSPRLYSKAGKPIREFR